MPGPELRVVQRAEYELVLKAAARLRPKDQEVLQLVMWEELSHEEIATVLGSNVDAVKQRFHGAKRRLADEYMRLSGPGQHRPLLRRQAADD